MYRITFFCPDRHIEYDGDTPYKTGIGGGVTARVRMARALRKLGHEVTVIANCPGGGIFDGVEYIPLDESRSIHTDVLVMNSSGGAMDLRSLGEMDISTQMKILWVQGVQSPQGMKEIGFDFLYAPSNFLAGVVHEQWGVSLARIFVAYNPFDEELFQAAERSPVERDRYRLVYLSHPQKGLAPALELVSRLRQIDSRYHLDVFGGHALWGQEAGRSADKDGLTYHGLIGQQQLAHELMKSSFSINLQTREEPFGMVLTESMRAGCVVVASAVGAFNELVQHGENGFLILGDPQSKAVLDLVVSVISEVNSNQSRFEKIRSNAQSVPWHADRLARVWTGHLDWFHSTTDNRGSSTHSADLGQCAMCGKAALRLDDGVHCTSCSRYCPSPV
jgi:glycosyltransferase involved in cell wall biosynthesis